LIEEKVFGDSSPNKFNKDKRHKEKTVKRRPGEVYDLADKFMRSSSRVKNYIQNLNLVNK